MSTQSTIINKKYLDTMYNAGTASGQLVLTRIKDLWWDNYLKAFRKDPDHAINNLDLCMDAGANKLRKLASKYSLSQGAKKGSPRFIQQVNQFLKSNTGKMFERFIGLAIAHYLKEKDASYCVWPFRADLKDIYSYLEKGKFEVITRLGPNKYTIAVDADLIIFNPDNQDADFFMISVKSTLKDRFHGVSNFPLLLTLTFIRFSFCEIKSSVKLPFITSVL